MSIWTNIGKFRLFVILNDGRIDFEISIYNPVVILTGLSNNDIIDGHSKFVWLSCTLDSETMVIFSCVDNLRKMMKIQVIFNKRKLEELIIPINISLARGG